MNQPISKECQHISAHVSAFFQNHERVPISPIEMDVLGGKPTIFRNIHILLDQVTIFPNFMAEDSKQLSKPQLTGHMKTNAVHIREGLHN